MASLTKVPQEQEEKNVEEVEVTYGMLLPADRCDRCGAQAYVRVVHPSTTDWTGFLNRDLLFCGHDFVEAQKTGKIEDWSVMDERNKLN